MIFEYLIYGAVAFAALVFYAWMEGLWYWTRPKKGLLDQDAAAETPPRPNQTHDINYIEGNQK